jgi:hypothetical protein
MISKARLVKLIHIAVQALKLSDGPIAHAQEPLSKKTGLGVEAQASAFLDSCGRWALSSFTRGR